MNNILAVKQPDESAKISNKKITLAFSLFLEVFAMLKMHKNWSIDVEN